MNKNLTSLGILFFVAVNLFSQQPQRPQGGGPPAGMNLPAGMKVPNIGRIYGKLLEAGTKQPVPYASVVVFRTMGKKDTILGGGLTLENGDFSIGELPFGPVQVKISFVGLKEFKKTLMIVPPDYVEIDLGDLKLESDAKVLGTVDVTAQKSQVQLNLDKRVFNVDKNITATGGTAEDVLKNIPSVTINSDGNAQLRNQSTTVFIDGRPTLLSINQIAADQIDNIEVITNPSAKFDASTSGGIINIVLKKNRKPGYNGFVSLSGGYPTNYNTTGNLNYKEGKLGVTAFYNMNYGSNPIFAYTNETRSNNGVRTGFFRQDGDNEFNRRFQVGRLSFDYSLNNRNTLTIAGNMVQGNFDIDVDNRFYSGLNDSKPDSNGTFRNIARNQFKNYGAQVIWKKTFPKKGQELTNDLTYNQSTSFNNSDWNTRIITPISLNTIQENRGGNEGYQLTYQLDYVNPLTDSTKIEMGLRSNMNNRDQDFLAKFVLDDNTKILIPSQSTDIRVEEMVNAAYITYTGRFKGIGYSAGLRFEQAQLIGQSRLDISQNGGKFGYKYPGDNGVSIFNSFFPSLYVSKKINKATELQVNFSRKINRPDFMRIMPFVREANLRNFSRGNPALVPEFINLAELNFNKIFGNNNWLISLYLRNEEQPITQFIRPALNDSLNRQEITFINGDNANRIGVDNTLKLSFGKNVDLTTNVNLYNTSISLIQNGTTFKNSGWAWSGKANFNIKLPKDFSIQLTGNYESEQPNLQGRRLAFAFGDFAIKKAFNRLTSMTLSINDVTNTRQQINVLESGSVTNFIVTENLRRRDVRNIRLAFQMAFGKMDASIFKKRPQGGGSQQQQMDF
jgi:outer membrane cobalamin receptor